MSARILAVLSLTALTMALPVILPAETLDIPASANSSMTMPGRGMTMEQVETEFGVPLVKHDTVGSPPITEWEYGGFSVYFESEWVIHSVGKRTRAPQASQQPAAEPPTPVEDPTFNQTVNSSEQEEDVTVHTEPVTSSGKDTTYPLPE